MILEPGMYVLMLNDMRFPKVEYVEPVVAARSVQEIVDLLNEHRHRGDDGEMYWVDEGRWSKVFRKGSPLEWFNNSCWSVDDFERGWDSSRIVRWTPPSTPNVPSIDELIAGTETR